MKVTRNVRPGDLADLCAAPTRACLAVVRDGLTRLVPVQAWADDTGYHLLARHQDVAGVETDEVLLVLDDGVTWFELRAVTVRGSLARVRPGDLEFAAGAESAGDVVRCTLAPRRVVAWDYGRLRPVDNATPDERHAATGLPHAADQPPIAPPSPLPSGEGTTPGPGPGPGPDPRRDVGRDVARFVHDSRVVVLGTTSARERPFATPLWFLPYRDALHLTTGAASWAGRNIGHHPEVSLLLGGERGRSDRRRLQVDGIAEVHHGLPPAPVVARLVLRYYLSPRDARAELAHLRQWGLRRRYYGQSDGSPGHVRVTVTGARFLPGT